MVDGHDLHALRESIRQAIDTRRPVVVHVRTVKGKGYEPAERHPDAFHGTGPFHLGNGVCKKRSQGTTFTAAFGQALVRLAETDERIVAITAAMTQGTGLEGFEHRFPRRFYDVGIAEEHAAVFAAGLAIGGLRPVVAVYSTFLQRAYDMLVRTSACSSSRWCLPSTGPAWWATTAPHITALSTSRTLRVIPA